MRCYKCNSKLIVTGKKIVDISIDEIELTRYLCTNDECKHEYWLGEGNKKNGKPVSKKKV